MSTDDGSDDITNFINYLDGYKKRKEINISDIYTILYNINYDFYVNNYGHPNYSGNYIRPSYKSKKTTLKDILFLSGVNYDEIESSQKECNNNTKHSETNIYKKFDFENLFEPIDRVSKSPSPKTKHPPPSKKTKITIDINISNLEDLLKILEKYKYEETEEYNIDLKSLVNIREELNELNQMIGMESLKNSILSQLLYFIQGLHIQKIEKNNETIITSEFKHTVICGPPGTGKTEIAKIIGRMYSKLGILKNNIFKKVTRNDLVAGYLGQTAIKTKKVIEECIGGVLFIDEAYSLGNFYDTDSYSKECIDVLCESMSDHKDDLMVIIAGYEEELEKTFFMANQGLESRFIWRFKIDEYTPKELNKIFSKKVIETDWKFSENEIPTDKWFEKNKEYFRNYGRDMELLFTYTKISHSRRIYGKGEEFRKKITMKDLDEGLEILKKNKKEKNKRNPILDSLYV